MSMTYAQMIDVITAQMEGKQIECRKDGRKEWMKAIAPVFNFNCYDYRVAQPALRPHWPALVRSPLLKYSVTDALFADALDTENIIGFVRLATEYPPVMLP